MFETRRALTAVARVVWRVPLEPLEAAADGADGTRRPRAMSRLAAGMTTAMEHATSPVA